MLDAKPGAAAESWPRGTNSELFGFALIGLSLFSQLICLAAFRILVELCKVTDDFAARRRATRQHSASRLRAAVLPDDCLGSSGEGSGEGSDSDGEPNHRGSTHRRFSMLDDANLDRLAMNMASPTSNRLRWAVGAALVAEGTQRLDLPRLAIGIDIAATVSGLATFVQAVSVLTAGIVALNAVNRHFLEHVWATHEVWDDIFLRVMIVVAKITWVIFFGLASLQSIGINTSVLAIVVGAGALIVGLAATDTVKAVFGLFTLVLSPPFVVGDWVEFNDKDVGRVAGRVSSIKFRTTLIRLFDGSRAEIPNLRWTNTSVVNWSAPRDTKHGNGKPSHHNIKLEWCVAHGTRNVASCADACAAINAALKGHPQIAHEYGPICTVHKMERFGAGCEMYFNFKRGGSEMRPPCLARQGKKSGQEMHWWKDQQRLRQEMVLLIEKEMAAHGVRFAFNFSGSQITGLDSQSAEMQIGDEIVLLARKEA